MASTPSQDEQSGPSGVVRAGRVVAGLSGPRAITGRRAPSAEVPVVRPEELGVERSAR